MFCSWAAEEYGLVGSTEWTEQFTTHLKSRAVAYLNVDMLFEGTEGEGRGSETGSMGDRERKKGRKVQE